MWLSAVSTARRKSPSPRRSPSAIGESRQTLRRCLQPIHDDYRDGIGVDDIEIYLAGCGLAANAELRKVAVEIQPFITTRYNLTTLATAVRQARKEAEDGNAPLSLDLVTNALKALCSTAAQRRVTLERWRSNLDPATGGAK